MVHELCILCSIRPNTTFAHPEQTPYALLLPRTIYVQWRLPLHILSELHIYSIGLSNYICSMKAIPLHIQSELHIIFHNCCMSSAGCRFMQKASKMSTNILAERVRVDWHTVFLSTNHEAANLRLARTINCAQVCHSKHGFTYCLLHHCKRKKNHAAKPAALAVPNLDFVLDIYCRQCATKRLAHHWRTPGGNTA